MFETNAKPKTNPLRFNRMIGHIKGASPGPTVVFFGGVHGNEPAGIHALNAVLKQLAQKEETLKGTFFAIAGNLPALDKNVRFLQEDLNRIWLPHRIGNPVLNGTFLESDVREMHALHREIKHILKHFPPPFYFVDLHTTSGETEPFIVMNDSLLNRRFTKNYPLPIILGIEEYLTGALLSYMNEMGFVAFGFESGQHNDKRAVLNAENFIWYTLGLTGFYPMPETLLNDYRIELYKSNKASKRFFEIYYQHLIKEETNFKMLPGFDNFQTVPKNTPIAIENQKQIILDKKRQLFMPLYQDKGYEGFYFIRRIPLFFLWLSKYCRKLRLDGLLARLPGIKWASSKKEALYVDKRIARFFAKSIFHLLGYRTREMDKDHFVLRNREGNSKDKDYKGAPWQ